jgi:hypothetical protein
VAMKVKTVALKKSKKTTRKEITERDSCTLGTFWALKVWENLVTASDSIPNRSKIHSRR